MTCNFATYAIYLLALMVYKYSELQLSDAIQKLNCKASWETPFFFSHSDIFWLINSKPNLVQSKNKKMFYHTTHIIKIPINI